jgi:two-component system OmpR family response regulator
LQSEFRVPRRQIRRTNVRKGAGGLNILLIEDDRENSDYVANGLREEGHLVVPAASGTEGLISATSNDFELLIVDRIMPDLDGLLDLVKSLRESGHHTPILFLTALGEIEDCVSGLNSGGDDYLAQPFAFSELLARVAILGRRPRTTATETTLRVFELELDLLSRRVRRRGELIELQAREFRLLEYLMRHAGQVVTRTMLLQHVWDIHFEPHTNVVETHVSRLRCKVDQGCEAELIYTVRGSGYSVRSPA